MLRATLRLMCTGAASHSHSRSRSHAARCADLLNDLLRRGRLADARAVAARLARTPPDPAVSDALVSFHARLGDAGSALSHLERLVQCGWTPSAASSAALFRAMCAASMYAEAMDLFVLWDGAGAPDPLPVSEFHLLIPGLCAKGAVDKARFLFDAMLGSDFAAPVRVYKSLVFAYCKSRRTLEADEVCRLMVKKGMHLDRVLCTGLIRGFCLEGRLELALDVFHRMQGVEHVGLDVYAYTTMIAGLFEHGYVDHGWELYQEMRDRGMEPSPVTNNVMIKWYCKSKRVGAAMELYNAMVRDGVAPDLRCYTILMTSLCREGKLAEAEHLFDRMLEGGIFPDHVMFISIARFFPKGWEVRFVRKALKVVAKLDCSGELLDLSSLASGCSSMSLQQEAERLLDEMVRSNMLPVDVIFNLMIIAMCLEGRLDVSYYLLDKLVAYGCEPSVLTYNIVIKCLCRQKRMDDARTLISIMQNRGVRPDMSTNSIMVTAYCKIGDIASALSVFDEMVKDGLEPSIAVYDSIIACLCRMRRLKEAEFTLRQMIEAGLSPDEVIYTSLLNGYSVMGRTRSACRIFDEMLERGLQPGSHAYGALINGLIKENKIRKALHYLERMLAEGFATQTVIYTMLINQFFRKGEISLGLDLVDLMMKNHIEPDLITYGALITGICRNIDRRDMRPSLAIKLKEARHMLFTLLPHITVGTRKGKQESKNMSTEEKLQLAQSIIQDLAESGMMPDLHIYNGMLNGLCRANKMDDAYSLLLLMDQAGVLPNHVTHTILMNNHLRLDESNRAIQLFNSLNADGHVFDKITYNTFIKGLSLAGRTNEALSFFLMMQKRGFVPSKAAYDKLMELLLAEESTNLALKLFEDMFSHGYIPRYSNYTSLLLILAKDNRWIEADIIFMMMLNRGRSLDTETKKCLEELCYKEGKLDLAFEMECNMPLYAVG
ncbi:pentatricopeptide repeat-containing protein At5g62370 [Phragmites australis]|uniref:pentatricopeptide repeat-containing protein At5g62370 n=1 Tax=Phragmites australis TaxID=29695 RepID=UPI002D778D4A|nr:pentatricopeptide repeat-containing protein At5g62370 [Phragmites australis]XP_062223177.1 pentatricopeptide repeat-containing protein At5g62370 [Phragmites australis]XP_062223178.1 pentatricopeptide repeat-containing protein At5g62370 [Phragmites australis]